MSLVAARWDTAGMDDLEGQLEALREPQGTLLPSEAGSRRGIRRRSQLLRAALLVVLVAVIAALLLL